jgi:hypothetical protein
MSRNSATFWLPKIEAAALPVPRTIVIPYDHPACRPAFDGDRSEEIERLIGEVWRAAREIGPPAFLRTDLASAKHSGPAAYKVESDHELPSALFQTLEDNELKFSIGGPDPRALLVREFLDLKAPFSAFRGLPIAREFRFFAHQVRVLCWHPYWPPEALALARPSSPQWRALLNDISVSPPPYHLDCLRGLAMRAAYACGGGAWSVDFAEDRAGKWWLIDMAVAADSFHWPGCEAR